MPDALHYIASLVKISNKFKKKNAQKQPKIVLSAGMETFEISKLENYKLSDIHYETSPIFVPPEHLQHTN